MLNFSATDFAVDAPDSTCVNADTSTLCDIFANSHIRAKDTIEGVININQNTRCKLTNRGSDPCHDWCWDVDSVSGDCVVVLSDIIKPCFFRIVSKHRQSNHDIHELRSLVDFSSAPILYQIFINNLSQTSICKLKITFVVKKCISLCNFLLGILIKNIFIIQILISKFSNMIF